MPGMHSNQFLTPAMEFENGTVEPIHYDADYGDEEGCAYVCLALLVHHLSFEKGISVCTSSGLCRVSDVRPKVIYRSHTHLHI